MDKKKVRMAKSETFKHSKHFSNTQMDEINYADPSSLLNLSNHEIECANLTKRMTMLRATFHSRDHTPA